MWPKPYVAVQREKGLDWPLFGFTMTGRARLDKRQSLIEDVIDRDVPGDIVKTGVWRGGNMTLAQAVLHSRGAKDRHIWLADSFEGMPKPQTEPVEDNLSAESYLSVDV